MTNIFWFRYDLRLDDHPGLLEAIQSSDKLIPVYIHDEESEGNWPIGSASKVWLHDALKNLNVQLKDLGTELKFFKGDTKELLQGLVSQHQVKTIFVSEDIRPALVELDRKLKKAISNVSWRVFSPSILFDLDAVRTGSGKPYQVYTPFWRACSNRGPMRKAVGKPKKMPKLPTGVKSLKIQELDLLPKIKWDKALMAHWQPDIEGARGYFKSLTSKKLMDYKDNRDIPSIDGTSRLSPFLHFGQISPIRLWDELHKESVKRSSGREHYLKELAWRDFGYHLLYHFPHLPNEPLREEFKNFPWIKNRNHLKAWQSGQTGYPLVDAGMRQLYQTGWMHNRIRMVVASFLVKHLRIHWLEGAQWFWDCLVDADLASNTMGWQWAGGCGPDAAPYFRIFNPILQSEKFDPDGTYIKTWVPELSKLTKKQIHQPWECSPLELSSAGITLGKTYPHPIVDHKTARQAALDAYAMLKKAK